jgi:hypothetical protein
LTFFDALDAIFIDVATDLSQELFREYLPALDCLLAKARR